MNKPIHSFRIIKKWIVVYTGSGLIVQYMIGIKILIIVKFYFSENLNPAPRDFLYSTLIIKSDPYH